jgi:hypothetical protein
MAAHRPHHVTTGRGDDRLVERAVAKTPSQVPDERMTDLGGRDQTVEGAAQIRADRVADAVERAVEPLEQRNDNRPTFDGELLRAEQRVRYQLELRAAYEIVDT